MLESMYMKKICVVSNVIGNRDVIHNGENGLVCSTAEEFADAIKTTEDSNNVAMSIHAYEDVLKEYNTKVMANKYRMIYEESLGN